SLAEYAMLAGLPKAPSAYNPIANPKRAQLRQRYVLRRMRELGTVSDADLAEAEQHPIVVKRGANDFGVHAEHFAEMVRQAVYERYKDDTYTRGIRIYTTVSAKHQEAAYQALRRGVHEYDRRHGYRGPEGYAELPAKLTEEALDEALQ